MAVCSSNQAVQSYYYNTILSEATDPNQLLYALKIQLAEYPIENLTMRQADKR